MEDDIPLVVPEVNPHHLRKDSHLVANPNCSTIQAMLPLKVIDDLFGLRRVVYTTFQAVSGAGVGGVNDLVNKEAKRNEMPTYFISNLVFWCVIFGILG